MLRVVEVARRIVGVVGSSSTLLLTTLFGSTLRFVKPYAVRVSYRVWSDAA
jgi:hypothetical protein